MRILYFHQHFSTPQGSTGIRSYEMAKALIANGHDVTIVCGSYSGGNTGIDGPFINGKRNGIVDGINVIEFELAYANDQTFLERSFAFFKFAWRSVKVALTEKYDLLFATTTPLTAAIPGIFAKLLRRKPFVFEVRDLWPELPKEMGVITNPVILGLLSILEWAAYKSANGHIGLSPGIKQGIERHLSSSFKEENPVALIPNGCDLHLFSEQKKQWQPNGIEDNDFVALFSGTHGQANGLHNVINAAKHLTDNKQIKIVLIGQGKMKPALIEQAKQAQLENVLFLDPVNKNQLSQLMSRANIGLQVLDNIPAFYFGTSPNKFFDYLSAGLPVLNNYPGWVAQLVTDNNCGVAVPADEPEAFANALISLSLDKDKCELMAENSLTLARTEFSRAELAAKFVEYLEKVAKKHA